MAGNAAVAIRFALSQLGKPYVYGAIGPGSWDCSGLMVKSYASAGYHLPRTTEQMIADPSLMPITKAQLAPGDLVFPESGHVQMYLGGGKVVEAPHTGLNVRIAPLGVVEYARRVTTPASGTWGGNATPIDSTQAVNGMTADDVKSIVAQGLGAGIPKFAVNILGPIGSWLIWSAETLMGLVMVGFGVWIMVQKSGIQGALGS